MIFGMNAFCIFAKIRDNAGVSERDITPESSGGENGQCMLFTAFPAPESNSGERPRWRRGLRAGFTSKLAKFR